MKKNWYAVYTKAHCEKKVAALLAKKKIENYYPLNRIVNFQANKKKTVYEPLLSTFVFVYISDEEMAAIKKMDCVINFIYWLGKPAVINNAEIENIQYFTDQHSNIKLEKTTVNANGIVKIISEPHIDINNNMVSVKKSNIKLLLPSLGYVMMAEIEKSTVDVFNYGFERSKMVS